MGNIAAVIQCCNETFKLINDEIIGRYLCGTVVHDFKGRFKNGDFITTSSVLSVENLASDIKQVMTKNSRYLVITENEQQ